jgi:hypothetical protein
MLSFYFSMTQSGEVDEDDMDDDELRAQVSRRENSSASRQRPLTPWEGHEDDIGDEI